MRLPRFRIRTLMIAIAAVGMGFWVAATFPVVLVACGPVALPLIGAYWRGRGATDRFAGAFGGGIIGGMIEAFAGAGYWVTLETPISVDDWVVLALFLVPIMSVTGFYLGLAVGVLVGIALRLHQDL